VRAGSEPVLSLYIDTSVIAAYYCPEPLSEAADRLLSSASAPAVSRLTEVELHSAVARKVRMGELDEPAARRVLTAFRSHLEGGYYRRIPLDPGHYDAARDFIATFSVPLRSLDALHLAVALREGLVLATADAGLEAAARGFGGQVILLVEA
jgi:uncharacterized protein